MDITQFRSEFPEFNDTVLYSSTMITFWATLAEKQVLADVWGDLVTQGVKLYVAHEITLAAQNVKSGQSKGMPGTTGGIATSKTVGSVSVTYDANNSSELGAGHWNLTTYGKQFMRLARLFGMGALQL